MQFKRNLTSWRKWTNKSKVINAICSKLILVLGIILKLLFACSPAFYFNMGKNYEDLYHSPPNVSVITGNILIMIIRFSRYHLLLTSSSTFMADSLYLGTIQIWWNLNKHYHSLISTKSVIWRKFFSSPQSLNMLPFDIRLERLKLIYYGSIASFSRYYFKTDTICLLFLSLHIFTALEFDSNHFGVLLWKMVNWTTSRKNIPKNINQSDIILWCFETNCRAHL